MEPERSTPLPRGRAPMARLAPALVVALAAALLLTGCAGPTTPPPSQGHTLDLHLDGAGTIVAKAAGVDESCAQDCTLTLGDGTEVTLTATAGAGRAFAGWSGDCPGALSTCRLTMDADRSAGASFGTQVLRVEFEGDAPRTVSVTPGPSGGGPVSCDTTCAVDYGAQLTVSVLLTLPDSGSTVTSWTGCDTNPAMTFCTVSLDGPKTLVIDAVHPPVAENDAYDLDEDNALSVPKPGVLANDTDTPSDTFTAVKDSDPAHGTLTLHPDGSFVYTPDANTNGPDAFSYHAVDAGGNASAVATVSLSVAAVNDPPTFSIDGDPDTVKDGAGAQSIADFATGIGPGGGPDEQGQSYHFTLTKGASDGTLAFDVPPSLADDGTLTYTPTTGTYGSVTYSAKLKDDGGKANGGDDTSDPSTFRITVRPLLLTLSINGAGGAHLTPPNVSYDATTVVGYAYGTSVDIDAEPDSGSTLKSWGGACSGVPAFLSPCRVTLTDDLQVSVNYTPVHTLAVSVTGSGSGTVDSAPDGITGCSQSDGTCSSEFQQDSTVTLTASPAAGTTFTGWGGACSGAAATCDVTMSDDAAVTAAFVLQTRALNVTKAGTGRGTITSAPSGIDCGDGTSNTCSYDYDFGTSVTLTATAATGSDFTGWSSAPCTGAAATCVVSMTAAHAATATFTLQTHTLSVSTTGSGAGKVTTVGSADIDCGDGTPNKCSRVYDHGASVTLSATTSTGSDFTGWSGGTCSGLATTCDVTMDGDLTVAATFTLQTPTLAVTVDGAGTGTVTSDSGNIACSEGSTGTCDDAFPYGTTVTLTAAPTGGGTFAGWGGACAGTTATCEVTMDGAQDVTATFQPPAGGTTALRPSTTTCDGVATATSCQLRIALDNADPAGYRGLQFDFRSTSFDLVGAAGNAPEVDGSCLVASGPNRVLLACDTAHRFGGGDILALTLRRSTASAADLIVENAYIAPDASTKVAIGGGSTLVN